MKRNQKLNSEQISALNVFVRDGNRSGREVRRAQAVLLIVKADGKIKTMYFPTAAPDENPQEHVWKSGRVAASHNHFIQNIDAATDNFVQYLNTTRFPYALTGFSSLS